MARLSYTLLGDGSSDRALIYIINWVLYRKWAEVTIVANVADLRQYPNPPKTLGERMKRAIDLYPAQLLFVHRDSEKEDGVDLRVQEIEEGIASMRLDSEAIVKVIPVRMTETWLLIDEQAIKVAAGNRNFRGRLDLPPLRNLEHVHDPKQKMRELIYTASGKTGRGRDKLNVGYAIQIVAEKIADFSILSQLPAFAQLERDIELALGNLNTRQELG